MDATNPLGAFGSLCLLCVQLARGPASDGVRAAGAFEYHTLQRAPKDRPGAGDSTPHGVWLDIAWSRRSESLGAAAAPLEIAAELAEAASHNENQAAASNGLPRSTASGNGRFEPLSLVVRLPLGDRQSVELGIERPFSKTQDFLVFGEERYFGAETRTISADTRTASLGYRRRWQGAEAAVFVERSQPSYASGTGNAFTAGEGRLWGAGLEAAVALGRVRAALAAGGSSGTVAVREKLAPAFQQRRFDEPFSRRFARAQISAPLGRWTATATAAAVHIATPFWDSQAPLNAETAYHDRGLDFRSRSTEVFLSAAASWRWRPSLSLQAFALRRYGNESVEFRATPVAEGSAYIPVRREGWAAGLGFSAVVP
jgi:hypothetical protein